jgi:hypothetical protein
MGSSEINTQAAKPGKYYVNNKNFDYMADQIRKDGVQRELFPRIFKLPLVEQPKEFSNEDPRYRSLKGLLKDVRASANSSAYDLMTKDEIKRHRSKRISLPELHAERRDIVWEKKRLKKNRKMAEERFQMAEDNRLPGIQVGHESEELWHNVGDSILDSPQSPRETEKKKRKRIEERKRLIERATNSGVSYQEQAITEHNERMRQRDIHDSGVKKRNESAKWIRNEAEEDTKPRNRRRHNNESRVNSIEGDLNVIQKDGNISETVRIPEEEIKLSICKGCEQPVISNCTSNNVIKQWCLKSEQENNTDNDSFPVLPEVKGPIHIAEQLCNTHYETCKSQTIDQDVINNDSAKINVPDHERIYKKKLPRQKTTSAEFKTGCLSEPSVEKAYRDIILNKQSVLATCPMISLIDQDLTMVHGRAEEKRNELRAIQRKIHEISPCVADLSLPGEALLAQERSDLPGPSTHPKYMEIPTSPERTWNLIKELNLEKKPGMPSETEVLDGMPFNPASAVEETPLDIMPKSFKVERIENRKNLYSCHIRAIKEEDVKKRILGVSNVLKSYARIKEMVFNTNHYSDILTHLPGREVPEWLINHVPSRTLEREENWGLHEPISHFDSAILIERYKKDWLRPDSLGLACLNTFQVLWALGESIKNWCEGDEPWFKHRNVTFPAACTILPIPFTGIFALDDPRSRELSTVLFYDGSELFVYNNCPILVGLFNAKGEYFMCKIGNIDKNMIPTLTKSIDHYFHFLESRYAAKNKLCDLLGVVVPLLTARQEVNNRLRFVASGYDIPNTRYGVWNITNGGWNNETIRNQPNTIYDKVMRCAAMTRRLYIPELDNPSMTVFVPTQQSPMVSNRGTFHMDVFCEGKPNFCRLTKDCILRNRAFYEVHEYLEHCYKLHSLLGPGGHICRMSVGQYICDTHVGGKVDEANSHMSKGYHRFELDEAMKLTTSIWVDTPPSAEEALEYLRNTLMFETSDLGLFPAFDLDLLAEHQGQQPCLDKVVSVPLDDKEVRSIHMLRDNWEPRAYQMGIYFPPPSPDCYVNFCKENPAYLPADMEYKGQPVKISLGNPDEVAMSENMSLIDSITGEAKTCPIYEWKYKKPRFIETFLSEMSDLGKEYYYPENIWQATGPDSIAMFPIPIRVPNDHMLEAIENTCVENDAGTHAWDKAAMDFEALCEMALNPVNTVENTADTIHDLYTVEECRSGTTHPQLSAPESETSTGDVSPHNGRPQGQPDAGTDTDLSHKELNSRVDQLIVQQSLRREYNSLTGTMARPHQYDNLMLVGPDTWQHEGQQASARYRGCSTESETDDSPRRTRYSGQRQANTWTHKRSLSRHRSTMAAAQDIRPAIVREYMDRTWSIPREEPYMDLASKRKLGTLTLHPQAVEEENGSIFYSAFLYSRNTEGLGQPELTQEHMDTALYRTKEEYLEDFKNHPAKLRERLLYRAQCLTQNKTSLLSFADGTPGWTPYPLDEFNCCDDPLDGPCFTRLTQDLLCSELILEGGMKAGYPFLVPSEWFLEKKETDEQKRIRRGFALERYRRGKGSNVSLLMERKKGLTGNMPDFYQYVDIMTRESEAKLAAICESQNCIVHVPSDTDILRLLSCDDDTFMTLLAARKSYNDLAPIDHEIAALCRLTFNGRPALYGPPGTVRDKFIKEQNRQDSRTDYVTMDAEIWRQGAAPAKRPTPSEQRAEPVPASLHPVAGPDNMMTDTEDSGNISDSSYASSTEVLTLDSHLQGSSTYYSGMPEQNDFDEEFNAAHGDTQHVAAYPSLASDREITQPGLMTSVPSVRIDLQLGEGLYTRRSLVEKTGLGKIVVSSDHEMALIGYIEARKIYNDHVDTANLLKREVTDETARNDGGVLPHGLVIPRKVSRVLKMEDANPERIYASVKAEVSLDTNNPSNSYVSLRYRNQESSQCLDTACTPYISGRDASFLTVVQNMLSGKQGCPMDGRRYREAVAVPDHIIAALEVQKWMYVCQIVGAGMKTEAEEQYLQATTMSRQWLSNYQECLKDKIWLARAAMADKKRLVNAELCAAALVVEIKAKAEIVRDLEEEMKDCVSGDTHNSALQELREEREASEKLKLEVGRIEETKTQVQKAHDTIEELKARVRKGQEELSDLRSHEKRRDLEYEALTNERDRAADELAGQVNRTEVMRKELNIARSLNTKLQKSSLEDMAAGPSKQEMQRSIESLKRQLSDASGSDSSRERNPRKISTPAKSKTRECWR